MLRRTGSVLLLITAVSSVAQGASSTTKSSTSTFLLPSIATSASEHIYATLIKEDDATTLWALGCQPDVGTASPTCTGAFRPRRTLTSGPSTMHLELGGGGSIYDCTRALAGGSSSIGSLTCLINNGAAAGAAVTTTTTTLTAAGAWMTPVTVIGDAGTRKKKTTTTTSASSQTPTTATTSTASGDSNEACKRDVALEKRKSGVGSGTGGSGGGDGTTGNGAEGGSAGTPGATKGNNNGRCSAGSRFEGGLQFISGMAGFCLMAFLVAI
ncbi:hypothetical protein PG997_014588 [Apiospora hydei]|uniref:Uncharacterized protein n=1 Tax=Apiospora hydei TaxID=1337664 RepID=A0ABR1UU84_9PEZI